MNDKSAPAAAPVLGLHHAAYRCRDAEETRHFYEDILGLPLIHVVKADHVPSTGESTPFVHVFFEMKDGSCIAFFDLGDNVKPEPSPNTPPWVNHLALKVPSVKDVEIMKARLEAHGVNVLGITDHAEGICPHGAFRASGLEQRKGRLARREGLRPSPRWRRRTCAPPGKHP